MWRIAKVWFVVSLYNEVEGCRFIAYLGQNEMDGSELLIAPSHNLLNMATNPAYTPGARASSRWNASQYVMRNVDENQDGFGVAWYAQGSDFARRIRSPEPLVTKNGDSHEVLKSLLETSMLRGTKKKQEKYFIAANNTCQSDALRYDTTMDNTFVSRQRFKSRAILAHVRAASTGKLDSLNAHPFTFNTLSWVHNGAIAGYEEGTAKAIQDNHKNTGNTLVAGQTDSEWAGAVFVDNLPGFPRGPTYAIRDLKAAMRKTIREITDTAARFSDEGSSLNFAVTDGQSLVAVRYRTKQNEDPPTLYYKMTPHHDGIIVASEPLDTNPYALAQWTLLGKDRILSFFPTYDHTTDTSGYSLQIECLEPKSSACDPDLPLSSSPRASSSSSLHRRRETSAASSPHHKLHHHHLRHPRPEFPYASSGLHLSEPGIITKN